MYDAFVLNVLRCYSLSFNGLFGSKRVNASIIRHDTFITSQMSYKRVNTFIMIELGLMIFLQYFVNRLTRHDQFIRNSFPRPHTMHCHPYQTILEESFSFYLLLVLPLTYHLYFYFVFNPLLYYQSSIFAILIFAFARSNLGNLEGA